MTDQPENSPETPEEPQPEEAVAETPAGTSDDTAADETTSTAGETTGAETPEPVEPKGGASEPSSEEEQVVAETAGAEPDQPVEVADAGVAEPVAETAESVTAEGEAVESDQPELTLGSGAPAETDEAVERPAPLIRGKIDKFGVAMGTGRRKTSVARVRIKTGTGQMVINGRSFEEYFCIERDRKMVEAPLRTTETFGKVDVWVRVGGGGTTGQTGAVVLGIARALQAMDPALHYSLADNGYLTRDGRMVERKKYGFKKARKSFQFSKR